jgi:hypothetical protein
MLTYAIGFAVNQMLVGRFAQAFIGRVLDPIETKRIGSKQNST